MQECIYKTYIANVVVVKNFYDATDLHKFVWFYAKRIMISFIFTYRTNT